MAALNAAPQQETIATQSNILRNQALALAQMIRAQASQIAGKTANGNGGVTAAQMAAYFEGVQPGSWNELLRITGIFTNASNGLTAEYDPQ